MSIEDSDPAVAKTLPFTPSSFGRPKSIELLVLINRRFSREIPIEPKYVGKSVDVINFERVKVDWEKNNVVLLNK